MDETHHKNMIADITGVERLFSYGLIFQLAHFQTL